MNQIFKEKMEKYVTIPERQKTKVELEEIICDCGMVMTINKKSRYVGCQYCLQEYFRDVKNG